MGYADAINDNIPMERHNGFWWFYPPCKVCGTPVAVWTYIHGVQYSCPECKKILAERAKFDKKEVMDKKDKKLEIAIKRISKVADIKQYTSAMKTVKKDLYRNGYFQSTEEIMTALELIKNGYKIYHKVKIYDYKVDFVIPDLKVVLELTCKIYYKHRPSQEIREATILDKLGDEWYFVRIDTENINEDITRLMPAIKSEIIKYRFENSAV